MGQLNREVDPERRDQPMPGVDPDKIAYAAEFKTQDGTLSIKRSYHCAPVDLQTLARV